MDVIIFRSSDKKPLKQLVTHGPEIPMAGDVYYIDEKPYQIVRRIFNLDRSKNLLYAEAIPYREQTPRSFLL